MPVVLLGRNRLFVSSNARRALIAIGGIMLVLILHRWVAMEYQGYPLLSLWQTSLLQDLDLPIRLHQYGMEGKLGLMCFSVVSSIICFRLHFWFGTLIMVIVVGLCVFMVIGVGMEWTYDSKYLWTNPEVRSYLVKSGRSLNAWI